MTDAQPALNVVRDLVEAFNRGDQAHFRAGLAHDAVLAFHGSQRICRGPDAILDAFWSSPNGASSAHWDVVNLLESGTHVTAEYVRTYESSKLGRQVTVPECAIFSVRDGRVVAIRHYADRMTELAQLGALALDSLDSPETTIVEPVSTAVNEGSSRALRRLMLRRGRHSTVAS